MLHYHKEIKRIKDLGHVDYIKWEKDNFTVSLRPIDCSEETIQLLTEWRDKYRYTFDTFHPTNEKTKKWVKTQIINNPDRILFLILLNDKIVGHIGLFRYNKKDNSVEITNVLRAVDNPLHELMEIAVKALLFLAFKNLKLLSVTCETFSDNYKAINLYERCGFLMVGNIPLKGVYQGKDFRWEPTKLKTSDELAEKSFAVMKIKKNSIKNFDDIIIANER